MLSRAQVMQSRTLQEATYFAEMLAKELDLYSDADCLVPKLMIQELMTDRGWNDSITKDKRGEYFRLKVAEKLVISWKQRKTVEIAMEVSSEVEDLVKAKLKKAGVSCLSMEQMAISAWKRITRPGRKTMINW
jgi:hypothetical protein